MENISILDKIISNHKAEEVARLNAIEIIENLFAGLNERERDILGRRFGLFGKEKETLEKIGETHKLTRERVRQIEIAAIRKLRQLENLENHINILKKIIRELLEEHGGFAERDYLLDLLVNFSSSGENKEENINVHKSHLNFLVSKLLHDEFEEVDASPNFKELFKFKHETLDHLEKTAEELLNKIREAKKVFLTSEIIAMAKDLESFKGNKDKFKTPSNIDISGALKDAEDADLINANKALYSVLQAHKNIEQNKFGQWGAADWREITPRTINDKIYLVLKNYGQPLHFAQIADKINQVGFDARRAHPATVHNELILDDKYVLIGRGLYGLAEWGCQPGTVADIIAQILRDAAKPLSRNDIIDKVLEQRQVKKATIILALMNKDKFEKTGEGKYKVNPVK